MPQECAAVPSATAWDRLGAAESGLNNPTEILVKIPEILVTVFSLRTVIFVPLK